ncbi:hypothetical protein WJX81_003950 [Elliptochloris bilobata]|uniref:Cation/H+ exchanger transmembrane domain-containing protein n=1 Tax=Elliptochloris bilobata TaxID=381761 RepID=A0AAW1QY45_9CHLO
MSTDVAESLGGPKKAGSGEEAVVTVLSTSAVEVGPEDGASALDVDSRSVRRPRRSRRKHAAHSVLQGLRRHYGTFTTITGYLALGVGIFAGLWLALGADVMLPFGVGWSVFLIWACAHVGGYVATQLNMPALLGMLVAGAALQNAGAIRLPHQWSAKIRSGGLAVILLRAGLKIDEKAFQRAGFLVARLGALPVLCEAMVDSAVFIGVYGMPPALGFTGGFILSALSPTVLVTGMLELQRRGYGHAKAIPSIEMAATGIDSVLAITGFAVASGIAIPSGTGIIEKLHGPLIVVLGVAVALIGGLLCSWTKLWNNTPKRAAVVLVSGLVMMYAGVKWDYLGAAALGCIGQAIFAAYLWRIGQPKLLSMGPVPEHGATADAQLAMLWMILVMPLLFGSIGAEIDFKLIDRSLWPKALLLIFVGGFMTRVPAAALALSHGGGFTLAERIFMAASWVPKATIQGALGGLPLDLVNAHMAGSPDLARYQRWASDILNTGVLAIVICAPLGLLIIGLAGPRVLEKGRAEGTSSSSSSSGSDSDCDAARDEEAAVTAVRRPLRRSQRWRRRLPAAWGAVLGGKAKRKESLNAAKRVRSAVAAGEVDAEMLEVASAT